MEVLSPKTFDLRKRKRVLVVAQGVLSSEKTWSGIPRSMIAHLGGDIAVTEMRIVSATVQAVDRHLHTLILRFCKTFGLKPVRFHVQDSSWIAKALGWWIGRVVIAQKVDVVLGLSCTNYISYVPGAVPIIHVTGSTFSAIAETPGYLDYAKCPRFMVRHYKDAEIAASARVSKFIVPARSGRSDLIKHGRVDEEKIKVIPYGPNIDEVRARSLRDIEADRVSQCELLFFGNDWDRKGGEIVCQAVKQLNMKGVSTHLSVVGPKDLPKLDCNHTYYGHLSKSSDADTIFRLFSSAFLLFVPSKSELFGVVYREAACFGLPSLAFDVGGVSDAVSDGLSGRLLTPTASTEDFVREIEALWADTRTYSDLRLSTAKFYDEQCSWERWRNDILSLIDNLPMNRDLERDLP